MQLAQIADSLDVALFSIGTELRQSTTLRPRFWKQLIRKVRTVYKGLLTYSANWDEYDQISFWSDLDYIGIDAYFPISDRATPDVRQCVDNWQPIARGLQQHSQLHDKKVLITEVGYRNVSYAGLEPWTHDKGKTSANDQAQVNLYESFFQAIHQQNWVAGTFLWQWTYLPTEKGNTIFSPQGKPAMEVVRKWFHSD